MTVSRALAHPSIGPGAFSKLMVWRGFGEVASWEHMAFDERARVKLFLAVVRALEPDEDV